MNSYRSLSIQVLIACLLFCMIASPEAATATIDYTIKYQTIEGFGGGLSFHKYPYFHPKKEELYDSIFNKAKVNVIRVGNWYTPEADTPVVEVPMIKEIVERWPEVKIMLTSWSPPAYLKSNNSIHGVVEGTADTGTLKKDGNGAYMYEEYGDYWLKSVQYFQANGMKIDWISIQNEPDWPAGHQGCVIEGRETATIASYGKCHTAVYNKLKNNLAVMIPMIGPDVAGIYADRVTRFITSPETNTSEMAAYCHHLYDHPGQEWFINAQSTITGKPIYQTEFLINEGQVHGDRVLSWIDNARFMHQSLAVEGVSMYNVFALAYNPGSMHTFFSQDTTWQTDWYETRNVYYGFKQFSAHIRRGWRRVEARSDDPTLLISAYCNESNDTTAMIIVNLYEAPNSVSLAFPGKEATVIQTSETKKYRQIATSLDAGTFHIDSLSVTTISLAPPSAGVKTPSRNAAARTIDLSIRQLTAGRLAVTCTGNYSNGVVSLFDCQGNLVAARHVQPASGSLSAYRFSTRIAPGRYLVQFSDGRRTIARTAAVVY